MLEKKQDEKNEHSGQHKRTGKISSFLTKIRRSKFYGISKTISTILAISAVILFIFNLNIFYIEDVQVSPFEQKSFTYIEMEEIEKCLLDCVGERIFWVDIDKISQGVLKKSPFVSEVYVSKKFPNIISVKIIERVPTLKVQAENGVFMIDKDLIVLSKCDKYPATCQELPNCEFTSQKLEVGENINSAELESIEQIQESLSDMDIKAEKFWIPEEKIIVVELKTKSRIIISTQKDLYKQSKEFQYTHENLLLQDKKYKEIDLRYDRPVIRFDKYTEWVTE